MDRRDTASLRDRSHLGTAIGIIFAVVVLTGVLAGVTAGQETVSVEIQPAESNVSVDGTTTLDVVVLDADSGVGAYEVNVSLSGESAEFTAVRPTGNPGYSPTTISENGTEASLAAAMGANTHEGAEEIAIAELDVDGRASGEVAVEIADGQVAPDGANMYDVGDLCGGTVTVVENGGTGDDGGDNDADDGGDDQNGDDCAEDDGGDGDGGADQDGDDETGGDGSGPGFGVVAVVVGLAGTVLVLRRRDHRGNV